MSKPNIAFSLLPNFSFRNITNVSLSRYLFPSLSNNFVRWNTTDTDAESNINKEDHGLTEDEISKKQNCSHLKPYHYRREHNLPVDLDEHERNIMPLWQYRKLYGRYGEASGVDVNTLWPSTMEMRLAKEREKVEFPHSVQEMIRIARKEKEDEYNAMMERQSEIMKNMKKLEIWKSDVRSRIEAKENAGRVAMERKKKQIEEVRKIFGYHIDPHNEKFKAALEKKEEEDKKRRKKEKKLQKQQRELEKLQAVVTREAEIRDASDSNIGTPIVKGMVVPKTEDKEKDS